MSRLASEPREHVLRRTSVRKHDPIAQTTIRKTLEKALGGFSIEVRDPSDEEPSPLCLKYASKESKLTPTRHTSQWYHTIDPLFWERGRTSGGVLHRQHPDEYPHTPLLLLAVRKVSEYEATMSGQMKTPRHARLLWNHILLCNHAGQSPLYIIHAIRKEEFRDPRWELDWFDQKSDKQTRSKLKPYPSFLTAEPCRENCCFAISSSRRLMFCVNQTPKQQEPGNHFHHLHPLLFPPPKEEWHGNPPEQRVWKQAFFRRRRKQFLP